MDALAPSQVHKPFLFIHFGLRKIRHSDPLLHHLFLLPLSLFFLTLNAALKWQMNLIQSGRQVVEGICIKIPLQSQLAKALAGMTGGAAANF